MSSSPFPEKKWKRPNAVAPIPSVWKRLTVKNENTGQTYAIRIQDITPDQYDEVWDMYVEHFYSDDLSHKLLNTVSDKESMRSERLLYDHILTQNLSLIAVLDKEDTKPTILGGLLLELPGKAHAALNSLLAWTREGVNLFEVLETDYLLKEFGLVVKREYRRMDIGTELFRTMKCMAEKFNFQVAAVVLDNPGSQGISAKLGMTLLKERKLIDCVDGSGQKVLPNADSEATIQWGYFKYA